MRKHHMKKIKILFIQSALTRGGAEQALFDLVNLLDKDKFDITMFVHWGNGEWEQKFTDAGIAFDVKKPQLYCGKNLFLKLKTLIQRVKIEWAHRQQGKGLIKACYPDDFDLIITYSSWSKMYSGISKHAKTVMYIHGDVETNEQFRGCVNGIRAIWNKIDHFVCVSQQAKNSFEKLTNLTNNVTLLYNPIDSERIKRLSECTIEIDHDDVPLVCAVGRLAEEKGYDRLIRIHKAIVSKGIRHRLVIVGDGPCMGQLRDVIADTGTDDSVILTGFKENPYPYMRLSDFMVCSSYTEGLPVIAMEALCLGVPIVSSAPSIEELFDGEKCGIITQIDDDSLEEGITRMLVDKSFFASTKAAAEKISSRYDGRKMTKKVEDMFLTWAGDIGRF